MQVVKFGWVLSSVTTNLLYIIITYTILIRDCHHKFSNMSLGAHGDQNLHMIRHEPLVNSIFQVSKHFCVRSEEEAIYWSRRKLRKFGNHKRKTMSSNGQINIKGYRIQWRNESLKTNIHLTKIFNLLVQIRK